MFYKHLGISVIEAMQLCSENGDYLWQINSFDEWSELNFMTDGIFLLFNIMPIGLICHQQQVCCDQ